MVCSMTLAFAVGLGLLIVFRFGSQMLWRLPVLVLMCVLLLFDLILYAFLRTSVKLVEVAFAALQGRTKRRLYAELESSKTFAEWSQHAEALDRFERREAWKLHAADRSYHPEVLRAAVRKIRAAIERGDTGALLDALRLSLSRNFGGHLNAELYTKTHVGTKRVISEFTHEVVRGIDWLSSELDGGQLGDSLETVADFMYDVGISFGNTCLFLSGGAAMGFYHFGVLRGLLAEGQLPTLVVGTSMGSIVAAYLACRTDEEALEELHSLDAIYGGIGAEGGPMQGSRPWRLWQLLRKGYMYEHSHMLEHLRFFTKDLTFAEAYARTGRVVSITCTPEKTNAVNRMPPMVLNHIVSPTVLLSSACMASSCVPGLIKMVTLQERVDGVVRPWQDLVWEREIESSFGRCPRRKSSSAEEPSGSENLREVQMRDGSFESDVPIEAMKSLFNTQFAMVVQVNPHITPFFYNASGAAGDPISWPWRNYRGGFLVYLIELWLKEDLIKNLKILQKTQLLFNVLGADWSYLFTQQDYGEVTIVPKANLRDYLNVMENIWSREELARRTRVSEQAAWQNFTQIRARTDVQRSLGRLALALGRAAEPSSALREKIERRTAFFLSNNFKLRGGSTASCTKQS
eukprot:TRINITY_DN20619_c0_g6_i2.p1 TRINITY_DN20619_c0_g6~~TRINITY_DN20619_c0_g6_i2.p1  ORF type:complete len:631 (+),score=161.16 TRINITY_DN20619_c0_g6_i2:52-1944(+)